MPPIQNYQNQLMKSISPSWLFFPEIQPFLEGFLYYQENKNRPRILGHLDVPWRLQRPSNTNILAPENGWLEDEKFAFKGPIGPILRCSFRECFDVIVDSWLGLPRVYAWLTLPCWSLECCWGKELQVGSVQSSKKDLISTLQQSVVCVQLYLFQFCHRNMMVRLLQYTYYFQQS